VKLTLNAYLSTLISFWNEIDKLAKALNISTDDVANIVKFNPRVSAYGTEFFGSPFGGKCLPKDLDQILSVYKNLGAEAFFFDAVKEFNKRV
jgi:UDPglucose 6-dehydrogenase